MVASTHWLASAAGMAVLERGGNAFDAAVAAGLHAAGRRAAPERPRRRSSRDLLSGRPRRAADAVRPGRRTCSCDDRAVPRARARPDSRARVCSQHACRARSAAWLLLLQEFGTWRLGTCSSSRSTTPSNGFPVVGGMRALDRTPGRAARRLAGIARALPPGTRARHRSSGTPLWPRRIAASSRSRGRLARRGDRARASSFYGGLRRRGDRRGSRRAKAGSSRATTSRLGAPRLEPVVSLDYRGVDRLQDRALGGRSGSAATARAPRRLRRSEPRPRRSSCTS